jgi:Replication-relaxation
MTTQPLPNSNPTKSPRIPKNQSKGLRRGQKQTLDLLAEYYCLTPPIIAGLRGVSVRSVNFTLQHLKRDGLVCRTRYVDPFIEQNAFPFVYGLTDKGVELWGGRTFDEHSRQLDHDLEIVKFALKLKELCAAKSWTVKFTHDHLARSVYPDLLIQIKTEAGWFHFFLEIEKSKKGFEALIKKLTNYYDLYDTEKSEKEWGFTKFRVLLVQRNEERMDNLLTELNQKLNHRMFWLATEQSYPNDFYKTPKDYSTKTYSLKDL